MIRIQFMSKQSGFTLLELLVVIAIIAVLIGVLLPAVQNVREAARRAQCANNLKQVALAAHNYHGDHSKFPVGWHLPVDVSGRQTGGTNLWIALLPYLEQDNLHQQWDDSDNRKNVAGNSNGTWAQVLKILVCPSDSLPEPVVYSAISLNPTWSWGFYGMSSYGGNAGKRSVQTGGPPHFSRLTKDGVFFVDSGIGMQDITDGTSHTLLFGERYHRDPEFDRQQPIVWNGASPIARWGRWAYVANAGVSGNVTLSTPVMINYRVKAGGNLAAVEDRVCAFGSGHPGANFAFADGSVRFLSNSTPLPALQALSTRAGDEVVVGDF